MDNSLSIGLSALLAAQKALDVAGHNIANAASPNYSRQRVRLAAVPTSALGPLGAGAGVRVVGVEAVRDAFIERLLLAQDPLAGGATRRAQLLSQVESLFSTDAETSLGAGIDAFFNAFQELSRNPTGAAERGAVVAKAQNLAATFNDLGDRLLTLRRDLQTEAADTAQQVNALTKRIADLNLQIRDAVVTGGGPQDLADERLTALRQLAELVPIEVAEDGFSRVAVRCGGLDLVTSAGAMRLGAVEDGSSIKVRIGNTELPFQPATGQLGALLEFHNTTLPGYRDRLDTIAAALIREVNHRHTTGVGLDGGFSSLASTNAVGNTLQPLNDCGLPFPLEPGAIYVSVTEEATGTVTQTKVPFDPNTDGLADVANALAGIGHLRASVNGGILYMEAEAGYRFDFTNKLPTRPGALGTAAPTFQGAVTLSANDTYTFTVDTSQTAGGAGSAGTIGATAGLRIRVTNAAGAPVATLDAGDTYLAGQALTLPGGVSVSFDAGDVADGNTLSVDLAAEPDAQGLLAALGLNALLRGNSAATFTVEPAVVADPGLVAAARSDAAADNTNALRLAELQDQTLEALGGFTLDDSCSQLLGAVGLDSQTAQRAEQTASLMRDAAMNQRDAFSGVNQDEEAVSLIQYQQLYAFAARYIKTIEALQEQLFSL